MKTGRVIGYLGCLLWLVSFGIRNKEYEVTQFVVGSIAILLLTVATIIIGVRKNRTWLGVVLCPFTIVFGFGLGFIIVMLVPKKELRHAV